MNEEYHKSKVNCNPNIESWLNSEILRVEFEGSSALRRDAIYSKYGNFLQNAPEQ